MVKVRQANLNDIILLQNLNEEVFIDNRKYDPDLVMDWAHSELGYKYFRNMVEKPETCCLIAKVNGTGVGYILATPKKFSYRKSKYLEIDNMGVIPKYRSKGIGSILMRKCMDWGKSHGYNKIFVCAYFANRRAVEFYKRFGFTEIDISLEMQI